MKAGARAAARPERCQEKLQTFPIRPRGKSMSWSLIQIRRSWIKP
jgi:hypothetical protein